MFTQYFVKTGPNTWQMNTLIDGAHPHAGKSNLAAQEEFKAAGSTPNSILNSALAGLEDPSDFRTAVLNQVSPMLTATPAPSKEDVVAAIARVGASSPISMNLSFDSAGKLQPITGIHDPNATPPTTPNANDFWSLGLDGTVSLRPGQWTPANLNNGKPPVPVANGALASNTGLTLDMRTATQFASAFAVNAVAQDGYTTGELAGIEIDDTGMIFARYTNGQSKVQGQVVLADFANVQGLTPVGKTQWVQSLASGEPVRNPGRTGTLGAIQAGALEDSNVELSDQLVNLIVAQRNYQANAKTIETESAITQTILNLR